MTRIAEERRRFVIAAGAALLLGVADGGHGQAAENHANSSKAGEKEVSAVEDLMREHGVLRRALLVYRESAPKLRSNPRTVDPHAIAETLASSHSQIDHLLARATEQACDRVVVPRQFVPNSLKLAFVHLDHGRDLRDIRNAEQRKYR